MPFTNFESRHFSTEEEMAVTDALTALETALSPKLANLSAEERQQYGSVGEQNKLVVNKVKEYSDTQPGLSSPDIDWQEFNKDYASRTFIESVQQRLANLSMGLKNAKILHDYDNYQASLTDYNYTKYKNETSATGYESKQSDLAQFFSNRGTSSAANTAPMEDDMETDQ